MKGLIAERMIYSVLMDTDDKKGICFSWMGFSYGAYVVDHEQPSWVCKRHAVAQRSSDTVMAATLTTSSLVMSLPARRSSHALRWIAASRYRQLDLVGLCVSRLVLLLLEW